MQTEKKEQLDSCVIHSRISADSRIFTWLPTCMMMTDSNPSLRSPICSFRIWSPASSVGSVLSSSAWATIIAFLSLPSIKPNKVHNSPPDTQTMDSIKSFKGYGKVDAAEDKQFRRKTIKRLILIGVSTVLLIAIIIGVVVGVVANKHGNTTPHTPSPPISTSSSIKAICRVTRYPDSCFSSISSVKGANATNDPEELFKLALTVAIDAISKVSTASDTFLSAPTNDTRLPKVLRDCKELLDDSVSQLTESLEALQPADGGGKALTESKVDDLMSWISAAVTNQETCLDGFEGTTDGLREKMEAAMSNSTKFTSNGLAIVKGILGIMANLNFPLHRKLLTTVPVWASGSQRRALLQEGSKPNVTVAADGSGEVKTIKEAVEMVPKKNMYPFVIYVKSGKYMENVVVDKEKWNVQMYGDGMYKTIVDGSLNFIDGTPTFSTATFVAVGRRFMARDMGFKNSAGPQKHQAVALRSGSDQSIFYRCSFDAFQDTLYAHSHRQFYRECDIAGTIDFIFGDAAVVFQNCIIRPRQPLPNQQNTITAQGRKDPNEETGISIQGSTITPYDSITVPTYLGRPWKGYSRTVIMQSTMGGVVDPAGWMPWIVGTIPDATVYCAEYQNTGPGSAVAGRITWPGYKPSLSAEEAKKYTVDDFLKGKEWISEAGVEFTSNL